MFRCGECGEPTPGGVPARKRIVMRVVETEPDRPNRGDIAREVNLCPPCAYKDGLEVSEDDLTEMRVFTAARERERLLQTEEAVA